MALTTPLPGLIEAPEAKPSETSTPCPSIGDVSQVIGTLSAANKNSTYDHKNSLLILKTFQLQPKLFRTDTSRDLVIHTLAKVMHDLVLVLLYMATFGCAFKVEYIYRREHWSAWYIIESCPPMTHQYTQALMHSSTYNFFHLTCLLSEEMVSLSLPIYLHGGFNS